MKVVQQLTEKQQEIIQQYVEKSESAKQAYLGAHNNLVTALQLIQEKEGSNFNLELMAFTIEEEHERETE